MREKITKFTFGKNEKSRADEKIAKKNGVKMNNYSQSVHVI